MIRHRLGGSQVSNPHLTVLETVVLPLNYTSKISFYSADTITQQAYDLLHLFLVVNAKKRFWLTADSPVVGCMGIEPIS